MRAKAPIRQHLLEAGCGLIAIVTAIAAAWPVHAAEAATPTRPASRLGVSTGFDWSTGDYGESLSTEIWYVPLNVRYEWRHWLFRVTLPYIRVTGPGNVVVGGDGVIVAGTQTRSETRDGIGDVIAGVTYRLDPPLPALPYLDFTVKAKFPTASKSAGLGTGEFDTTLQLDITKPLGSFTPFATLAYRFVGDPPGTPLHNTLAATLGFDWRFTRELSAGLYYGWRQTASDSLGDAHDLVPYASWKVGRHLTIGPYVEVGLSTAAPDVGVGLQLGFRQ